jgi:threonylcarbamoyladenosine tRNA methylthiotransferase MtaB
MRFHIHTFGCRVNMAESDKLALELLELGLENTARGEADLVVINSCAITAKAVREVRQLVNQIKQQKPKTKVWVTGCAATLWQKTGESGKPADCLVDNEHKSQLAQLIKKDFALKSESKKSLQPFGKFLGSTRLMVKVQDGCDYFCTYCIVPHLRGRSVGADPSSVLKYIMGIAKEISVNEVVLSGINLGLYLEFTTLVKLLLKKTIIPKLSFGSLYMENINSDFLGLYQSSDRGRLTRYLHVPLQSGSAKILGLMNRRYTLGEFTVKLNDLVQTVPDALLATDIIVGFLGETATDFEATYTYLKNSPIVRAHIFKYSRRELTAGELMAKYHKEPTPQDKTKRSQALHQLFKQKLGHFQEALIGQRKRALILRQLREGYLGLLDNGLEIIIPGGRQLANGFVNVQIEQVKQAKIVARLA